MLYKTYFLIFFLFNVPVYAKISGTIIDSTSSKPLENVNIIYGDFGTTSDKEGKFFIEVDRKTKLKFSHIGYKIKYSEAKDLMQIELVPNILFSENIIVKAGLIDESLSKLTSSVSIFSSEEIKKLGADHFQIVTERVPNLNWAGGTSRPRYFQIRGIGERSHYFGEGPPNFSVGFNLDDLDLSGLGMVGHLYDIDQIEILKGPQSSVYGANALAGIVSMRSKNPDDEFDAGVSLDIGDYEYKNLNTYVNISLVNGFAMRLNLGRSYHNGFRKNISRAVSNSNKRDEEFFRLKLKLQTLKKFNLLLTVLSSDLDNGYDVWAPDNNKEFKTYTDDIGKDSQATKGISIRANFSVSDKFKIVSISSITKTDLIHSYDSDWADDFYWLDNHGFDPLVYGYSYKFFDKNIKERKNITQEFRTSLLKGKNNFILGVYLKNLTEIDTASGYLYGGSATEASSEFNFDAYAGYLKSRIYLNNKIIADANFRFEKNSYKYFGVSQYNYYGLEELPLVNFNIDTVMTGFKSSIIYFLNNTSNYFISFSRGFKAGGVNQHPYLSNLNRPYSPEFIRNFEFGFKYFNKTTMVMLTFFNSIRDDQQVSVSSQQDQNDPGSFFFYTSNAGSGENSGLEFESSMNFFSNLSFKTSFGILKTYIEKFSYLTFSGQGFGGNRQAAMSPRIMGSFTTNYERNDFYISVNSNYKDEYYFSDSHKQKSKPYSLTNLIIGKSFEKLSFKFWTRNLFDKRYTVRGFYFGLIPPNFKDELFMSYGDPREVGFSLEYKFK
mgnify:CR=1 FL=1